MKVRCLYCFVVSVVFLAISLCPLQYSYADGDSDTIAVDWKEYWGRLKSHEENGVGYTLDDDDEGFVDFKVSLDYPFFHNCPPRPPKWNFLPQLPYFAFTGRFGQYMVTRDSSPVIAKRFNPEIFFRGWYSSEPDNEHYVSMFFGHESNGQSIDSQYEYLEKRNSFSQSQENPDFAKDYLSRGWDYVGFDWRKRKVKILDNMIWTRELVFRYFLENGPLQKGREDYNDWENDPEGKPREYVDGIRLKVSTNIEWDNTWIRGGALSVGLTTGYSKAFKYITYRFEYGLGIRNMPISVWISSGYSSDLAQYYKKVTSVGGRFTLYSF